MAYSYIVKKGRNLLTVFDNEILKRCHNTEKQIANLKLSSMTTLHLPELVSAIFKNFAYPVCVLAML
jgi:hypothetical protein